MVRRIAAIPGRLAELEAVGSSPLVTPITEGRADLVQLLLDAGANPNARLPLEGDALAGAPVLALAVVDGRSEIVDLLLAKGADPNSTGAYGATVLANAMASGYDGMVRSLRSHGANLPPTAASLVGAAGGGYDDDVRRILSSGVPVDAGAGYKAGTTALMAASGSGRVQTVRLLIGAGADVERVEDATTLTPMGMAAERGHTDVVAALIAAGAKTDGSYPGADPESPLHVAARAGQVGVVQALLAAGADPAVNFQGTTAVQAARAENHNDVAASIDAFLALKSGSVRPRSATQAPIATSPGSMSSAGTLPALRPEASPRQPPVASQVTASPVAEAPVVNAARPVAVGKARPAEPSAVKLVTAMTERDRFASSFPIDSVQLDASADVVAAAVEEALRHNKEKGVARDASGLVVTTEFTRHGILGFAHYDRYAVASSNSGSSETWMVYRLLTYLDDVNNAGSYRAETEPTFMDRRRRGFVNRVRSALKKNH